MPAKRAGGRPLADSLYASDEARVGGEREDQPRSFAPPSRCAAMSGARSDHGEADVAAEREEADDGEQWDPFAPCASRPALLCALRIHLATQVAAPPAADSLAAAWQRRPLQPYSLPLSLSLSKLAAGPMWPTVRRPPQP
jgi:hypothetical protein